MIVFHEILSTTSGLGATKGWIGSTHWVRTAVSLLNENNNNNNSLAIRIWDERERP